jgi:hypothetical protein
MMAVSGASGLWGLGSHGLWMDEGFTASMSLQSFGDLVDIIANREANASAHSLLSWGLGQIAISEAVLRLPSVLFIAATVGLVGRLGRQLVNTRVGLIAAGGSALHGGFVLYSQSARTYAMTTFVVLAAASVLASDVRRPRHRLVVAWTALGLLALSCHLFAAVALAGQLLCLIVARPPQWRRYVPAAVVVLGAAVVVGAVISNHEEGQDLVQFDRTSLQDAVSILTGRVGVLGALVIGPLAVVGIVQLLRRFWACDSSEARFGNLLVVAMAAAQPVGLGLLSLIQPALLGRFVLPSVPGVMLCAAIGVEHIARRHARLGVALTACSVAVTALGGLRIHLDTTADDWRGAARYVADSSRGQDRVVFANDSIRLFFEFERARRVASGTDVSQWPTPVFPDMPWREFATGDQRYASPSRAELGVLGQQPGRIWMVVGFVDDEVTSAAHAQDLWGEAVSVRRFAGGIEVLEFVRP